MAIRITVSDQVSFKVRGTINNETGAAQAFDFDLVARRLSADAMQSALADDQRKIPEFMAAVVTGWRRVIDDEGADVSFTHQALEQLFQITGLASIAFKAYLEAAGAKEKN